MTRKLQLWIGGLILAGIGISIWAIGAYRVRQTGQYSQPNEVRTTTGTNYLAQLVETTVGRLDAGYLITVAVRLTNPHPDPLQLNRNGFILVDHDKDYFLPTATGTSSEWIVLPAHGTLESEKFTFVVPADSLDGVMAIQLGQHHWVMIKAPDSQVPALRSGEFLTFRRRHW